MYRIRPNALYIVLLVALLSAMMASSTHGQPAVPDEPAAASETPEPIQAAQATRRFVPMIGTGKLPTTVFGVEMIQARPDRGLNFVADLGPAWVRRNGLLWKDVEPIEDRGYKWTAPSVAALDAELIAISERGLQPILIIRGYPSWAARTDCAPIEAAKMGRFVAFVSEAVKRYSQPPFNVRYWELGNEPDAPAIGADSVYGCWGVASDPYFGGRRYGDMLKQVYPAIKAANSQAQVLNGGLLIERPGDPMLKFLEGMLVAGAGNSFDILSFHSYCMFDPKNPDGHDVLFRSCASDWKLDFLRNLTRQYGIPTKPMFRTEAALICSPPTEACRQQQAQFVTRHYARAARDGLMGAIWYAFDSDSFQHSGLIEPTNPTLARPAYWAMKHAAAMFGGAIYLRPLTGQTAGVEGYIFGRSSGETIAVAWSNKPLSINVPVTVGAAVTCTGNFGQPVVCSNSNGVVTLPVGPDPSYVLSR